MKRYATLNVKQPQKQLIICKGRGMGRNHLMQAQIEAIRASGKSVLVVRPTKKAKELKGVNKQINVTNYMEWLEQQQK